ncbi:plasmid stabilization system protein ParE [Prosthecobacter vanneervenii]|uniref:Plasmid stabilization system protein ParE n=1 Tax=Prosthecobacter vanneervenii TaxID=48466 RepID=A0A7W7YE96_9BACT|nr:plasmid stabilization system protein ParE [Prosthecobacter vanneervenii]
MIYTSEARLELNEAGAYYRRISKELAQEFKQRLVAALEAIRRNPETWRRLDEKYRRKLLKQFPYGVIYHQPEADCIEVVAVMHLNREPDYWRGRIG